MNVRSAGWTGLIVLAFLSTPNPSPAQERPGGFYDVDREIRIEGPVREVRLEPRYENKQPFLLVIIEDQATGRVYSVEIGPAWFLDQDIHRGEKVKIVGSLVSRENADSVLMAREVQCRGEIIRVRDRNGFPNWRGGPMKRGRNRRGPAF